MAALKFGDPESIKAVRAGAVAARVAECRDCDDRGKILEDCDECEGTGETRCPHCDDCQIDCEACDGKGKVPVTCEHPDLPPEGETYPQ